MTQQVFLHFRAQRESLKEQWANGAFSAAFKVEMAVKNAGATGACSIIQDLLELSPDDIFGDE